MTLDELALQYGTDKASNLHNYTRWYARHLPARDTVFSLLEIGVKDGASLRMWRDYFPYAIIEGIDIRISEGLAIPGVRLLQADQKKLEFGSDVSFDVIIDDGSHRWEDQQASFKALWEHVAPGGLYVIEDLHTSYFMEFGAAGENPTTNFLYRIYDDVNLYGVGGLGDIRNHSSYESLKDKLSIYQRTVESMTFYKSIVFIRKSMHVD